MTKGSKSCSITKELIEYRPDAMEELLSPLRDGKSVLLRVEDPRMMKRKRGYQPVLALVPMVQLGLDYPVLLAAFPPFGSELLDTRTDLKTVRLARLGLSLKLAKALATALRKVLWRMP